LRACSRIIYIGRQDCLRQVLRLSQTVVMTDEVDWVGYLEKAGVEVTEENQATAHSYSKRWFYDACIVAFEDGDCSVALHPGLSRSARSEVCERAKELIEHFRNEGPAGAWQPRSDGGYQVWLTQRYFSDDGVEEVPPSARLVADDELWRSPL
jgi:hypothetical protein